MVSFSPCVLRLGVLLLLLFAVCYGENEKRVTMSWTRNDAKHERSEPLTGGSTFGEYYYDINPGQRTLAGGLFTGTISGQGCIPANGGPGEFGFYVSNLHYADSDISLEITLIPPSGIPIGINMNAERYSGVSYSASSWVATDGFDLSADPCLSTLANTDPNGEWQILFGSNDPLEAVGGIGFTFGFNSNTDCSPQAPTQTSCIPPLACTDFTAGCTFQNYPYYFGEDSGTTTSLLYYGPGVVPEDLDLALSTAIRLPSGGNFVLTAPNGQSATIDLFEGPGEATFETDPNQNYNEYTDPGQFNIYNNLNGAFANLIGAPLAGIWTITFNGEGEYCPVNQCPFVLFIGSQSGVTTIMEITVKTAGTEDAGTKGLVHMSITGDSGLADLTPQMGLAKGSHTFSVVDMIGTPTSFSIATSSFDGLAIKEVQVTQGSNTYSGVPSSGGWACSKDHTCVSPPPNVLCTCNGHAVIVNLSPA